MKKKPTYFRLIVVSAACLLGLLVFLAVLLRLDRRLVLPLEGVAPIYIYTALGAGVLVVIMAVGLFFKGRRAQGDK